jgi:G:T-mismatch repair DNA endonuclease (very short patch repair protein)
MIMKDYSREHITKGNVTYYRFKCVDCGAYHYSQKIKGQPRYLRCLKCSAIIRGTGRVCSEETRKKISNKLMGHPPTAKSGCEWTPRQRELFLKAKIGKPSPKKGKPANNSEETTKKLSLAMSKRWQNEEYRQSQSEIRKKQYSGVNHPLWGKHHSAETKKKQSLAKKGKSHRNYFDEEQTAKASERLYAYMKTHTLSNYNKTEQKIDALLQSLFPNEYKYNGTHGLGFKIFAHAPDFVNVNGQKKLIEFNGCVWHCCPQCGITKHPYNIPFEKVREKDDRDIKRANELGYKVFTIWGHDLKDMENTTKKLVEFHNE